MQWAHARAHTPSTLCHTLVLNLFNRKNLWIVLCVRASVSPLQRLSDPISKMHLTRYYSAQCESIEKEFLNIRIYILQMHLYVIIILNCCKICIAYCLQSVIQKLELNIHIYEQHEYDDTATA